MCSQTGTPHDAAKEQPAPQAALLDPGEEDAADAGNPAYGVKQQHRRRAYRHSSGQGKQVNVGDLPGKPVRSRIKLCQHGELFAKEWWSGGLSRTRPRPR